MAGLAARWKKLHQTLTAQQKALAALRLTALRFNMSADELSDLASLMTLRYLQPNEFLYKPGDAPAYIALISKGIINVRVAPLTNAVAQRTSGEFLGYVDEHDVRAGHEVTVEAKTVVRLFVLEANALASVSDDVRKLLQDLAGSRLIRACLRRLSLFSGVSDDNLHMIAHLVHFRAADPGQVLIREADQGAAMFIMYSGRAQCTAGTGEFAIPLDSVADGDYFGEIALLMGIPRTATVTCDTNCLLFELRSTEFKTIVDLAPSIEAPIRTQIQIRIAKQFRRYKGPFFASLSDEQLMEMGPKTKLMFVPANTIVFNEGDKGALFYMIAYGTVDVYCQASETQAAQCTSLAAGSYFGELALLHDRPRKRTAKTVTDCLFLTLDRADFQAYFKGDDCRARSAAAVFKLSQVGGDDEISPDAMLLVDILHHPIGVEYLINYCKSEMSQENVEFWMMCDRFARANVTDEERATMANKIYSQYLADSVVNLPAYILDQIKERLTRPPADKRMYIQAQNNVFRLIESDVYPRFLKSPAYDDLRAVIKAGAYRSAPAITETSLPKETETGAIDAILEEEPIVVQPGEARNTIM
ncbi:Cyclic nucleotide-binding domain-containing protein [Plasmodiophora brassicae]